MASSTRYPDFIIIGAMKCGTTSLFNYLKGHPRLVPCRRKEPSYFAQHYDKGPEWYSSLYPGRKGLRFEASTDYTKHPVFAGPPERIHEAVPDARLIYMTRHPIKRIISHLQHNLAQGRLTPEELASPGFWDGRGKHYLYCSMYNMQLEQYLQYFPLDRFLFIRLEDMGAEPMSTLERVSAFLDIDPAPFRNIEFRKHNTARDKVPVSNKYLKAIIRRLVRAGIVSRNAISSGKKVPKPELTESIIELLWTRLGPDMEQFEKTTGTRLHYNAEV